MNLLTPQQANEEIEQIYTEVGRVISTWSGVESTLAHVFHLASGAKFLDVSFSVLAGLTGFQTRLKMIDNTVKTAIRLECTYLEDFDAAELRSIDARWSQVKKKLEQESQFRNQLAHRVAMRRFDPDARDGPDVGGFPMLSLPYEHPKSPKDFKSVVSDGITYQQIREINEKFQDLIQELSGLQQDWLKYNNRVRVPTAPSGNARSGHEH